MFTRITTIKPRPTHTSSDLRSFDVTIVEPNQRKKYTVLAHNGREAVTQASALFDGQVKQTNLGVA